MYKKYVSPRTLYSTSLRKKNSEPHIDSIPAPSSFLYPSRVGLDSYPLILGVYRILIMTWAISWLIP